jgi:hypothetical protein
MVVVGLPPPQLISDSEEARTMMNRLLPVRGNDSFEFISE